MGVGGGRSCLPFGVSTWVCVQAFEASGPAGCWRWSSGRVFPPFVRLCCSALGALLANMALFRAFKAFLEGFMVVVWVYCFGVLCVACVVFVRVWS